MTRTFHRIWVPVLVMLALAAGPARGDVISPEQASCRGKATGTACDVEGKAGACQPSTCGRLDYSHGTPPTNLTSHTKLHFDK